MKSKTSFLLVIVKGDVFNIFVIYVGYNETILMSHQVRSVGDCSA